MLKIVQKFAKYEKLHILAQLWKDSTGGESAASTFYHLCLGGSEKYIIEVIVITFWFKGIPWNHHKLYSASCFSSRTLEYLCIIGISWYQNPPSQVLLPHKSKFNHVLISGNFMKLGYKLYPPIKPKSLIYLLKRCVLEDLYAVNSSFS